MIYLTCAQDDLTILNNGTPSCVNWVSHPVALDFFSTISNEDFSSLLAALIKFGFAAFFVWWLVWAARRF